MTTFPATLGTIATLLVCLALHGVVSVQRQLRAVRSIPSLGELPIIVSPVDMMNPLWFLFGGVLTSVLQAVFRLRGALWLRVSSPGWTFDDGPDVAREAWRRHARACELQVSAEMACGSFIIVSPGGWRLVVGDGPAVEEAIKRYRYWHKAEISIGIHETFGQNLVTANGDDWVRHQRATAPCFGGGVSALVWDEACRQTARMMAAWHANTAVVSTMHDDTRRIAMHVLARVGLGTPLTTVLAPGSAHSMTSRDVLAWILDNPRVVSSLHLLLPPWLPAFFRSRLVPARVRHAEACTHEFRRCMEGVLAQAREDESDKNTLAAALVRSCNEQRLSDAEAMGNLYMLNVAGQATTANLISFALTLLAMHQHTQDWLRHEVQELLGSGNDGSAAGRFRELFPKMVRMLAVQNETLRLFGTAHILRVAAQPTVLTLSSGYRLAIPAGGRVLLDMSSVGKAPAWDASGYPVHCWAPQRWIQLDLEAGEEKLVHPPGVTYLPFAAGPRTCPGQSVARVASAAVLTTVLKQWLVKPGLGARKDVLLRGNISEREEERLAVEEFRNSLMTAGLTTDGISVTIPKRHRPTLRVQKLV